MPVPTLTTERLVLRELDPADPDDQAFVLALVNDPDFVRHIADLQISDLAGAADYIERACAVFYRERDFGKEGGQTPPRSLSTIWSLRASNSSLTALIAVCCPCGIFAQQ